MKFKKILSCSGLVFFAIFHLSCCQAKKTLAHDFRRASWGMSLEEVKKTETGKFLHVLENNLAFRDTMLGCSFFIVYAFEQDRLYMGGMVYEEIYSGIKGYEENFARLKDHLSGIHGKPRMDEVFRSGGKLRKFREASGDAAAASDPVMVCHWLSTDKRTQCTLILDNSKELKNLQIVFKDTGYQGPPSAFEVFVK